MSGPVKDGAPEETVNIAVTRQDLDLIRSALEEYLATFSHEEGDLIDRIKTLLARLPDGQVKKSSPFRRLTL